MDILELIDNLIVVIVDWVKVQGSGVIKVFDILDYKDVIVLKVIQKGIDKVNERVIFRVQKIQKWFIFFRDFFIFGGELGRCNGLIFILYVRWLFFICNKF